MSQQASDVTGEVADVTSRVTSARAAIAQLRALLRRAGSVNSLLNVQNQINAEESMLEELQAQQRALAHETSYATVSLRILSSRAPPVIHKRHSHGFLAGLSAGWRALKEVMTSLLTGAGSGASIRHCHSAGSQPRIWRMAAALAAAGSPGRAPRASRRRPPRPGSTRRH